MKHLRIFAAVLLALSLNAGTLNAKAAWHNNHASAQTPKAASEAVVKTNEKDSVVIGDSVLTITDNKGNNVVISYKKLAESVKALSLDDTIASWKPMPKDINEKALNGIKQVTRTVQLFFVSVVLIVALSLLFYFLHRARKYKTIERAIASGYPLPPEFFGRYNVPVPPAQQAAGAMPQQQWNAQQAATAQQPQQPQQQWTAQPAYLGGGWNVYKGGYKTTVVGLAGVVFFAVVDAMPLVVIFAIITVVGLGKLFFAHNEQRVAQAFWNQQAMQQQQPQQPEMQQPPVFNPNAAAQNNDPWGNPQQS